MHRVLGGAAPRRPSAVAGAAGADVGASRRSTTERLRRLLRGDLDNVVLKALAREPDRRYASVGELARDIRRHQSGLPVDARAATWTYRAGKFVRRHKAAVAGVCAVGLLLVAFAVVTARQARVLQQERDRARREAETAQQVSKFLVNLFEDADPSQSRGETVTAREILDRGAERISRELGKQPAVRGGCCRPWATSTSRWASTSPPARCWSRRWPGSSRCPRPIRPSWLRPWTAWAC